MSLINKLKRRGERWSPWGTPEMTDIGSEIKCLYLTNCNLLIKNESNQERSRSANSFYFLILRLNENNISCQMPFQNLCIQHQFVYL